MKHILKPGLLLFVIAAVSTASLALTHNLTLEPIANQRRRTQERTLQAVMPQATAFRIFSEESSGSIVRIFECLDGEDIIGYVAELASDGYSGSISMMVGFSKAENALTGMRIMKHSETPGLGDLAAKEQFYRGFDGRALEPLRVAKGTAGNNEIQAITAATITTRAVVDAVNEAIEWFKGGINDEVYQAD